MDSFVFWVCRFIVNVASPPFKAFFLRMIAYLLVVESRFVFLGVFPVVVVFHVHLIDAFRR